MKQKTDDDEGYNSKSSASNSRKLETKETNKLSQTQRTRIDTGIKKAQTSSFLSSSSAKTTESAKTSTTATKSKISTFRS